MSNSQADANLCQHPSINRPPPLLISHKTVTLDGHSDGSINGDTSKTEIDNPAFEWVAVRFCMHVLSLTLSRFLITQYA